MKEIKVADVVFREDLYPRIETSATTVQKYAEDLDVLPEIEVNQHNELIDGRHRWTAHKKAGRETIRARVTETANDAELLELAIERNAAFGMQLATSDKKRMARRIYRETAAEERGAKKKRLAKILSMSESTVHEWLKRIDKDTEEERNAAVLNLYLQCRTSEEIAESVGMSRQNVDNLLQRIRNYEIVAIPGQSAEDQPDDGAPEKVKREWDEKRQAKIIEENRASAEHLNDFEVPLYNVWKTATVTQKLAKRCNPPMPAFVLLYTPALTRNPADQEWRDISGFRAKRIWPKPEAEWKQYTPEEWAQFLVRLREWSAKKLDDDHAA